MNFLTRTDKVILSLATLVLAIFSYFLYDDSLLFEHQSQSHLEQIGKIYLADNDVRIKNITGLSWIPARGEVNVHQKDSIFTGDRSEVAIQLNDGSIIHLKENSLVTLNVRDGQMTLDLKYGDFVGQLAESSKLKVKAGEDEFDLKGDNDQKAVLAINKSRSGQLDIKLQEGSAEVQSKNEVRRLEKDKALALSQTGQIKELPKPVVELVTPHNAELIQGKNGDPIPLEWTSNPKVPAYKVEIARDSKFTNIVWNGSANEEKVGADLRSGPGSFFWRVQATTSSGQVLASSKVRSIKVIRMTAPVITYPEMGKPLIFELPVDTPEDEAVSEFKITWKADPRNKRFRYQIAKDKEFEDMVREATIEGNEAASPKLPTGIYFVRVRGEVDKSNYGQWSAIRPVSLNVTIEKRPDPPQLAQSSIEFDPQQLLARNPSSNPAPELEWSRPERAAEYRLQIADNQEFENPITITSKSEKFAWQDYHTGTSYFRVYALSHRGVSSLPSETGVLNVQVSDPVITPFKELIVNGEDESVPPPIQEVKVSWSAVPSAKKYVLEVDESEDNFSSSIRFEVTSNATSVTVPKPGQYDFRVKAQNGQGMDISNYSAVEKLTYIYRIPLKTPVLFEPFDKTTVFMQQGSEPFIWLEWKEVTQAKAYEVQISTSPDFANTVIETQVQVPRFLLKDKVPYGKLYWRVRALSENPDLNSEWAKEREFNIMFRRNEIFK